MYQTLENYKGNMYGSLHFGGMEYDREVPDNLVVASPGGVSSVHHHYTKGFYGNGGSQTDLFANQGQRNVSGTRDNLYQMGRSAGDQQHIFYPPESDVSYTAGQSTPPVRDAFEFVQSADTAEHFTPTEGLHPSKIEVKFRPYVFFILIVIAYVAFGFWYSSIEKYLIGTFNNGKELNWKQYAIFGLVATVIMVFASFLTGTSLIEVESL